VEESSGERSPSDDAASAENESTEPGEPADHEQESLESAQTEPLVATVAAVTAPPVRRKRRGHVALLAASVLVLVASVAASLFISGGNISELLLAFTGATFTSRANARSATTWTAALGSATATSAATGTPPLVGEGSPPPSGTFPPYNGPISQGQGCPSGQAPKPVSWAIHRASDYGAPKANAVALTFDDGPTPYYSPAIISYLEKTRTPATFFVLGQYAKAYPYLIQREAADGFTIGIHTWSHPDMRLLTPAQRAWQLAATAQQLHTDLGANFCLWLWRPPYGSYNSTIVAQAGKFGLTTIIWNDDPFDWSQPGTMTIVNRVLSQVHPGSIILMHDGPGGRAETLAALPYILAGLRQRGLTPVSLPQLLLGYPQPTPTTGPTATPSPTATGAPTDTPTPTDTPSPTPTDTPTDTPTSTP
jgi:peptidoglycan/xylan/chitin deacetylase (PgdA/CDA1 family)